MTLNEQIKELLSGWTPLWEDGSRVRLATHCLYPSNENVSVVIEGGVNTFVVRDGGGAVREARSAGFCHRKPEQLVRSVIRSFGLSVSDGGEIYAPNVGREDLIGAVIVVANAAAVVAQNLCGRIVFKRRRNIKEQVKVLLEEKYSGRYLRDVRLVGESNKGHKFDYVVTGPKGEQLVLDVVLHDPNSINSTVVANLDLKNANRENLKQRIIYDDHDAWPSSDLRLLNVGAVAVPYSRVPEVLSRLAA